MGGYGSFELRLMQKTAASDAAAIDAIHTHIPYPHIIRPIPDPDFQLSPLPVLAAAAVEAVLLFPTSGGA